jgi:hypothetical protein
MIITPQAALLKRFRLEYESNVIVALHGRFSNDPLCMLLIGGSEDTINKINTHVFEYIENPTNLVDKIDNLIIEATEKRKVGINKFLDIILTDREKKETEWYLVHVNRCLN